MKSRNLKAIFAALSAVAVMATAMTGFAATTAVYNTGDDKVSVIANIEGATGGSEVTYLVKSKGEIVYIDQATANDAGAVSFTYKIAKAKITDYETAISYGTDGAKQVSGEDTLGISTLASAKNGNYTITYDKSATVAAKGEKVNATFEPTNGYQITSVKVNGSEVLPGPGTFAVSYDDEIVVETEELEQAAVISEYLEAVDDENNTVTGIISYTGTPSEVGVICNGYTYPAATTLSKDSIVAVQLKLPATVVASSDLIDSYIE